MPNKALILVVDDELEIERLIKQCFREQIVTQEFDFLFASHGLEALDILKESSHVELVLADLNMPEMDGFALILPSRPLSCLPTVIWPISEWR